MADLRWPGSWFRLAVRLPAAAEDLAVGLVQLCGGLGTSTRAAGPGRVDLEAWFDGRSDAARAEVRVAGLEGAELLQGAAAGEESDDGWLERGLSPRPDLRVGPFVIRDPTRVESGSREFEILLPLGRAFGTGEHATTRMCLELLAREPIEGRAVLDLGCGSAILAIAAARRGARFVLALDDDPAVIEVARENVGLNHLGDRIEIRQGSWGALASADPPLALVLANIHRTGCERAAAALLPRLAPASAVILSGFTIDDADRVARAWSAEQMSEVARMTQGEWAALLMHREDRPDEG